MCVSIYIHISTPSLRVCVYIFTHMPAEFTYVCVYICIYAHRVHMCRVGCRKDCLPIPRMQNMHIKLNSHYSLQIEPITQCGIRKEGTLVVPVASGKH